MQLVQIAACGGGNDVPGPAAAPGVLSSARRARPNLASLLLVLLSPLLLPPLRLCVTNAECQDASADPAPWQSPLGQFSEVTFDGQWTSDIALTESTAGYRCVRPGWELRADVSFATMGVDYTPAPADIISAPERLDELRVGGQLTSRYTLAPGWVIIGSAGYYDGFTDYRSLWLSEYYRQYFFEFPEYETPSPRGYSLGVGVRCDYAPGSASAQLEGFYNRDDVAPGYEIEALGPLRRGTATLYTVGARLRLENVLTSRLRVLNEFQLADSTDRDPRLAYQGSVNWAITDHLVARAVFAAASEDPQFDSVSFGGAIEWDSNQRWFLGGFGRYYTDQGQIENEELVTSATPPLDTWQAGLSVRWQGSRSAFKLAAGPYFSRYAPATENNLHFAALYQDRDWLQAQATWSFKF